jgi:hypothetical protein
MRSRRSRLGSVLIVLSLAPATAGLVLLGPLRASATALCGASNSHTLCVTVASPMSGLTNVTVTNAPNDGTVIATWIPSSGASVPLITQGGPAPMTQDYSFVWPTQKYLDGQGTLRLQAGSTSAAAVDVGLIMLSNGNSGDFQHSPSDWESFLPGPWAQPRDPVVAAVGDGPSDEPTANAVAQSIVTAAPDLFLFLGDIYENGTFTENLNHYGENSMDGGAGTLWGQVGTITQPTLGNHENSSKTAWRDYFHGRPLYTSYRFGNTLFFDLASSGSPMGVTSAQYNYVKNILTDPNNPPPPCIVTYWHIPALNKANITSAQLPMWKLLTDHGGDLLISGHVHNMAEYKPLNDALSLPSSGEATMIELVNGAGGHQLGTKFLNDPRVQWSVGQTAGVTYLTLNGAASGGIPTSLSWSYRDLNGDVLRNGTRDCGGTPPPNPPSITGFTPTSGAVGASITISGSDFTGATDVTFNGASVGAGNFTINSDTMITAPVPAAASTGPIAVIGPGGTGTSAANFTVLTTSATLTFLPSADSFIQSTQPDTNFGSRADLDVLQATKDTLLRFTVSGVGAGVVSIATLRLYCTDSSTKGGAFFRVADSTWDEGSVTWTNAPAAEPGSVASLGAVTKGTWVQVDLSSLVTGDGTYSLRVTSPTGDGAKYSSKEGPVAQIPQLVVTYGSGG